MALWIATPKVYIHNLLHHDHSQSLTGPETQVKSSSTEDCDYEKYDKPVYFNIFKFIFSFIPVKSSDDDKVSTSSDKASSIAHAISLLRAPPVTE
ncbi:MAG: hypothetical protein IT236_00950 [Bacteroidia bacterium]|nr:hypothetical protein [Bacteroidia bacterium]